MPTPALVKPTQKAVQAYYQTLRAYGAHAVAHESALRSAFQNLLAETAKAHRTDSHPCIDPSFLLITRMDTTAEEADDVYEPTRTTIALPGRRSGIGAG